MVLHGREIWPRALREDHRLRAFGKRALKRIFRLKSDEFKKSWRKLKNEGHNEYLYFSNMVKVFKSRKIR